MYQEYHKEYSYYLQREMEFKVYGRKTGAGVPLSERALL